MPCNSMARQRVVAAVICHVECDTRLFNLGQLHGVTLVGHAALRPLSLKQPAHSAEYAVSYRSINSHVLVVRA